jgi:hypothetical protein
MRHAVRRCRGRQNCVASVEAMRRLLGKTAPPLTIDALRQALRAEP